MNKAKYTLTITDFSGKKVGTFKTNLSSELVSFIKGHEDNDHRYSINRKAKENKEVALNIAEYLHEQVRASIYR